MNEDNIIVTMIGEQQPPKDLANNSTLSTKLSSDQLICKTPQESPSTSVKSLFKQIQQNNNNDRCSSALYLGIGQLFFGFLMAVFGVLAVFYNASLAQVGGGIWGGCLVMSTGVTGVLAGANNWCPLKSTPQKIAHTVFLALSLISLAISQLVVALGSTGLGRDINNADIGPFNDREVITLMPNTTGTISITLPANYQSLLASVGLVIVSLLECILAAIASYKSARIICPCFRKSDSYEDVTNNKDAMVKSWLGKHTPLQQFYIVTAPTSTLQSSKSSAMPVFLPPMPMPPPPVGYTLIPAPLGTIPSPIIPPPIRPSHPEFLLHKQRKKHIQKSKTAKLQMRRSKSKETISDEDIVKSYTGLDKTIAEEFIEICDSRNNSLCSDSNCCQSNSDTSSREYLVNK